MGMGCNLHFSTVCANVGLQVAAFFAYTASLPDPTAAGNWEKASVLVTTHTFALIIVYAGVRLRRKAFADARRNERVEHQLALKAEALEALGAGVLVTDAARRIVYVNHAWCAATGYARAEVVGRLAEAPFLVGPDTDTRVLDEIQQAIEDGRHFRGEVLSYKKGGRAFWNELTIAPVRVATRDGVKGGAGIAVECRPVQFVETIHDVTQKVMMRQNEMNLYLARAGNQALGAAHHAAAAAPPAAYQPAY